jgi:hypothetical protein
MLTLCGSCVVCLSLWLLCSTAIVCHAPGLHDALCLPARCWCMQVKSVLQQLTAMNPNPTIGLAEAAEMLCKHLGVALVRYNPPPRPHAEPAAACVSSCCLPTHM